MSAAPRSAHRSPAVELLLLGLVAGLAAGLAAGLVRIHQHGYLAHGLERLSLVAVSGAVAAAVPRAIALAAGLALLARGLTAVAAHAPLRRQLPWLLASLPLLAWPWLDGVRAAVESLQVGADSVPRWRNGPEILLAILSLGAVFGLRGLALRGRLPRLPSRVARARVPRPLAAVAAGLAVACAFASGLDRALFPPQGPPVVLIAIDTLRADHLGSYGYRRATSPAIDALARDGILYRNAHSTAPWTTPSVASVFTARHPARLGFRASPIALDPGLLSIAELLRERNYRTCAVVANLYAARAVGLHQGFDCFDDSDAKGYLDVSSASVSDKAIRFLDAHRDEPFFLYLHYFDPHYAYRLHAPEDAPRDDGHRVAEGMPMKELRRVSAQLTDEERAFLIALYDSEIRYTDEQVGRVLERMRELGLYDGALIVLFSDHGEELAERGEGWVGHERTLYQEQLRVPLVVKLPGGARGASEVEEAVSLVDLGPTLLRHAGTAFPPGYVVDGSELERPDPLVLAETRRLANLRALVHGRWKLIHDLESGRSELYDVASDPRERDDLSEREPERRDELVRLLTEAFAPIEADAPAAAAASFEADEVERLRSLGYVD